MTFHNIYITKLKTMPDIYINTDRPVDRSIVAGLNQPQREAPAGAFVAGSSYDTNLYFVRNDGSYDPASGDASTDIQVAISTISTPESGVFTLTDGTDTTDIEYGASGQAVEDALNALNSNTGPNLGTASLVDVVKQSNTQYTITWRTLGAQTALSGASVSLFPESTPTGSIAVDGSATQYAQQVIELTRQPAIYQQTWTTIANGHNGTLALNTTRLLQSLVLEQGEPFYIEVKLDGETVAREVVSVEASNMPASAFSGTAIKSLLDAFAADPTSNSYFDAVAWGNALSVAIGAVTSVNGQTGAVLVATVAQGALADTAVQPVSTDTLTNKTIADISNNVHADLLHLHVRATEPILKGQAVKFDGYNQGQASIEVSLADQLTDVAIGLAQSDIGTNQLGLVVTSGVLKDVDTSSFTEGAILYVNGSGQLQEAEPTSGNSQPIALCLRSNLNNGVLDILADYPKQPSNDVRNDSTVTGVTVEDALNTLETLKQNILSEGAFLDGDKTKLDGIETGATSDQTGAEIKAAYELEASAFTDPQFTKLAGIESGAQVNIDLFGFALSDEETALTTDNGIIVDMPHDLTIKRVYASLRTAGTTSATEVELLDGVTAVLDSSLSITAATTNAETSLFSGAAASYTMSKGDKLTIQVTAVDSAGTDAGIKVFLEGTR